MVDHRAGELDLVMCVRRAAPAATVVGGGRRGLLVDALPARRLTDKPARRLTDKTGQP
jgi:hypothetical protein